MLRETDALLVNGGDVLYLSRWMRQSGLADLLPSLRETVYVGWSAGSMVTAPIFGETYDDPESSTAKVERMAAEVPVPTYGIDDQTAIQVVDGAVEVISEGHWKLFTP